LARRPLRDVRGTGEKHTSEKMLDLGSDMNVSRSGDLVRKDKFKECAGKRLARSAVADKGSGVRRVEGGTCGEGKEMERAYLEENEEKRGRMDQ